jgi:hypothetical protein
LKGIGEFGGTFTVKNLWQILIYSRIKGYKTSPLIYRDHRCACRCEFYHILTAKITGSFDTGFVTYLKQALLQH